MNYIAKLYQRWNDFLHNEELKEKIYTIVFESDTPKGKLFDIVLIGSIILSVLLVILESMHIFPHSAYIILRVLEYLLTLFFTIEYLARIYCLKQPRTYVLSFFGIVDLAGIPKDVYYMYQSEWTDTPVLHLFPHWNWKKGETVDVWAYYNQADEVELFLNGESLGVKSKPDDAFHVCWRVPFTPGTLKAVSRKDGKEVLTREIRTAGEPARIMLIPDRSALHADGTDLSFVTVEIQDKDGNLVPDADNLLRFTVEGDGFIAGTDNGDQNDPVSLKKPERHAFYGKAMAVVQNTGKAGLPDAIVEIKVGE